MDVEKTIQFLVENAAQHNARLATLENNLITLTSVVKTLAETQAGFKRDMDEMREEMRERDAKSRERDALLDARSRERDAALDERISKLVSAIAALVNGRSGHPPAQA